MNGARGADGGGPPKIAVALLIADEGLRQRALDALNGGSCRLTPVADLEAADVIITDHEIEADVPEIFLGDREAVADAVRKGCAGGLLRSFSAAKLRIAVEAVGLGLACIEPSIELAPTLEEDDSEIAQPELTVREAEVLRELIAGASNKEIARRLHISVHTAKFHVASIITKLGAHGRTDAVARALRLASVMM